MQQCEIFHMLKSHHGQINMCIWCRWARLDKKSPETPFSEKGCVWMSPDESRWVHAPICLVLCVLAMPVAQICLVLSVPENGSDWQLTQIGLQGCEISRTLDRIKTDDLEKSRILVSFLGPKSSGEPVRGSSLSRTLERKIQFWAGRPLLNRNSPSWELCKHVKTRGFGRKIP